MKHQVTRVSLHQNAKVSAVMMAVTSLVFVVPFMLIVSMSAPKGPMPPPFFFLLFPLAYLVIGYVMTIVGCAVYNLVSKYIGGIEFESSEG